MVRAATGIDGGRPDNPRAAAGRTARRVDSRATVAGGDGTRERASRSRWPAQRRAIGETFRCGCECAYDGACLIGCIGRATRDDCRRERGPARRSTGSRRTCRPRLASRSRYDRRAATHGAQPGAGGGRCVGRVVGRHIATSPYRRDKAGRRHVGRASRRLPEHLCGRGPSRTADARAGCGSRYRLSMVKRAARGKPACRPHGHALNALNALNGFIAPAPAAPSPPARSRSACRRSTNPSSATARSSSPGEISHAWPDRCRHSWRTA